MKAVNTLKTALLLVLLSALFLGIGHLIGGQSGMVFAFIMSLLMNFGAYWFSDKIVLAMHKAQAIKPGDSSGVYEIVGELCRLAKLPMPKVYRVPEQTPNAFATGRDPNHAARLRASLYCESFFRRIRHELVFHPSSHEGKSEAALV